MKRDGGVFSFALTWDGARWPKSKLTAKALAFLGPQTTPSRAAMTKLFQSDQIAELRICWVPQLSGGGELLNDPFTSTDGKRLAFRASKFVPLGDMLGVIYRR